MKIQLRVLFTVFFSIFLFISHNYSQVNRYHTRGSANPKFYSPDINNLNKSLCVKQLELDMYKANEHLKLCLDNTDKAEIDYVMFDNSSWLESAMSYSYQGEGYSVVILRTQKMYFFKYISPHVLNLWMKSNSPGIYYNRNIRNAYNLSDCVQLAPKY